MKRQIYILAVNGTKLFGLGFDTEYGPIQKAYAFTHPDLAEVFIRHMEHKAPGKLMIQSLDGDRFLVGMLEALPDKGFDIVCLDQAGFPLTENGVVHLARDVDGKDLGFTPEEWATHIATGKWKQARFDVLMRVMGEEDEAPLTWDNDWKPPVVEGDLRFGYGIGKSKRE